MSAWQQRGRGENSSCHHLICHGTMLFDFGWNNPKSRDSFFMHSHVYSHKMSSIMYVCVHRVSGMGMAIGEAPAFFTTRAAVLSGTGPCEEGCEEFAEMFHSTMVRAVRWVISHLCLPLSYLFIWPAYYLAIFYFSTLFIPLFSPAFNPQPHPRVSHDACFLFSFSQKLLLNIIRGDWLNKHHC